MITTSIRMLTKRFLFLLLICCNNEVRCSSSESSSVILGVEEMRNETEINNFKEESLSNSPFSINSMAESVMESLDGTVTESHSSSFQISLISDPVINPVTNNIGNKEEDKRGEDDGSFRISEFDTSKTNEGDLLTIQPIKNEPTDQIHSKEHQTAIQQTSDNTIVPIVIDKSINVQLSDKEKVNPIPTPVVDVAEEIKGGGAKINETASFEKDQKIEQLTTVQVNSTLEHNNNNENSEIMKIEINNGSTKIMDIMKKVEDLSGGATESEAMPSFDEWKRKMLAEQDSLLGDKPIQLPSVPGGKKPGGGGGGGGGLQSTKRRRNYASSECGAKVVASNFEAEAPNRILNEQMDMYMLNPCKAKIWFIIELCESIQATQFEMANFELFSSLPKDFTLQWSDRFPTRDWTPLGSFVTPDQRTLHSFNLKHHGYGKFLKVDLQSHYGREHYCPLSLIRVYGTSMVDEYEEMETGGIHLQNSLGENDEEKLDAGDEDGSPSNIFGSARDVVYNIVRKAARVLGREEDISVDKSSLETDSNLSFNLKNPDGDDNNNLKVKENDSKSDISFSNRTTHSLEVKSKLYTVGLLLDECGLCLVENSFPNSFSSPYLRKCLFLLSVFNISSVAHLCQSTACSLAQYKSNKTLDLNSNTFETIRPSDALFKEDNERFKTKADEEKADDKTEKQTIEFQTITASTGLSFKIEKTLESIVSESLTDNLIDQPIIGSSSSSKLAFNSSSEMEAPEVIGTQIADVIDKSVPVLQSSLSEIPSQIVNPVIILEETLSPTSVVSVVEEVSTPMSAQGSSSSSSSDEQEIASLVDQMILAEVEEAGTINIKLDSQILYPPEGGSSGGVDSRPIPVHNVGINIPTGQKESVFMRLSNRIKILEMNMSLSSQYLQELSQRYRRQMEEMQRGFNRTVAALNDTAQQANSRDKQQQEAIRQLQVVVTNLTRRVDLLTNERESLYKQVLETHLFLLGTETIVVITVLTLCLRRMTNNSSSTNTSHKSRDGKLRERSSLSTVSNVIVEEEEKLGGGTTSSFFKDVRFSLLKRHNSSIDVSSSSSSLSPQKKRRPSENVSTAGTYTELLIVEPALPIYIEPPNKPRRRNRNRNKSSKMGAQLERSISNPDMNQKRLKCPNCSIVNSLAGDLSSTGKLFAEKQIKDCENCCCFSVKRLRPSLTTITQSPLPPSHSVNGGGNSQQKVPLKNVTNGKSGPTISSSSSSTFEEQQQEKKTKILLPATKNVAPLKEQFSIRKLLKFQKKESF